jgi:hypothetical protein
LKISTRDLSLIIVFAALLVVLNVLISRIPETVSGIAGFGYLFTILYSITLSVAYLMYGGRRWRIIAQTSLYALLYTVLPFSSSPGGTIPPLLAGIVNAFVIDIVFNSVHGFFERRNKLQWWVILTQLYYWGTHSIWTLLLGSLLFFSFEMAFQFWFIPVMSVMLPVMIVEAVAGGYLGYKVFRRVEKIT